jgi:peptidoglycan hydrolase-like protein with peptidoglycan-binding domain
MRSESSMDAHEEFIARLYPAARKIATETGMSWELMLAQAAHETGWGRKALPGTNNAYNVKAAGGWTGETKTFRVWEKNKKTGKVYWVDDAFRVYDSVEDSLRDRVKFLRENPRYAAAGLFDEGTLGVLEAEASALEKAGFASDDDYAIKLVDVFHGRTMRRAIARVTGQEVSPETVRAGIRNGTLREGHHSVAVGELQSRLHRLGYGGTDGTPLTADQNFGRRTRLAVEAFQREHQLEADGIAGRATLAAVENAVQTELRSIGRPDAPYLRAEEPDEAMTAYQSLAPEPTFAMPVLPVVSSTQAEPKMDALQAAAFGRRDPETTRCLQENLNTLGVVDMKGEALAVDGLYGPSTRTAVARFQSEHELPITGLADETTRSMAQGQAFIAELRHLAPSTAARDAPALEPMQTPAPVRSTAEEASVSRPTKAMDPPNLGLAANDPRNPESSTHELYNELQRCVPDASENRLLQFTAACHENMITAENLSTVHLDEEKMTLDFRGSGPLTTPAQVDLSAPPPMPEQAVEQIQRFDQQEMQMAQAFQAQSMELGQQGMVR